MSASEKLKALERNMGPSFLVAPVDAVEAYRDALPQIVAVVEAAEGTRRELSFVLLSCEPKEHRESWEKTKVCPWITPDCLWCRTRQTLARDVSALAALDEALGD